MQRLSDSAAITGTKKTADGYLIADAFAARTGIQTYLGYELKRPELSKVRVYRPEEEVLAADAMASFSHTPVTLGHPKEVNAENWKALAVGEVSTEAVWDGSQIHETGAMVDLAELPVIAADADQMVMVFQHLIENGLKFQENEPPHIKISAEETGKEWTFTVADNGIGIDPRFHDRIFTIFQRLHGREAYGGSGSGLTIAKKVVERHGGRMWVESQEGEGSRFIFTIPTTIAAEEK